MRFTHYKNPSAKKKKKHKVGPKKPIGSDKMEVTRVAEFENQWVVTGVVSPL